jgi:hypothetical protein
MPMVQGMSETMALHQKLVHIFHPAAAVVAPALATYQELGFRHFSDLMAVQAVAVALLLALVYLALEIMGERVRLLVAVVQARQAATGLHQLAVLVVRVLQTQLRAVQ